MVRLCPFRLCLSDAGATVEAEYLTEVLAPAVVENLLAHYVRLLDALVQHPDAPLRSLDLLGDEDRARLRALATGDRFDAAAVTLPALVQAQVARTPDAVAVVADDIEISFDELDRRANRVAHWLISRGVGPEDLVALSFGRSVDMVVTAYGVLKAGAAYVPVDPTYPADRIAYMLSDAAPTVALSADDDVEGLCPRLPRHHSHRRGPGASPAPGQPRLRHLHLRIDRHTQGRPGAARRDRRVPGLAARRIRRGAETIPCCRWRRRASMSLWVRCSARSPAVRDW